MPRLIANINEIVANVFRYLMYRDILVYVLVLCAIVLIAGTAPFDRVLREDAFNYVVKGMQIANGDFELVQKISIGWAILLGAVFWVMQVETLFEAMRISRWVSIFLVSASFIPIMVICKQILPRDCYGSGCLAILFVLMLDPSMHFSARSAMTEPLFIFLTLACVMFFMLKDNKIRNVALAAGMAALAFYVRPNGLFVFAGLFGAMLINNLIVRERPLRGIAVALTVFISLCVPYMLARYIEFGSMLDFGPNSKYFVEHYEQVWADNIHSPSLLTYLLTHDWTDYYRRFIELGLFRVLEYLGRHLLPKYWILLLGISLIIYVVRAVIGRSASKINITLIIILVTIAGLSPVFQVFAAVRHLIYLIPLILITGVWTVANLQRENWQFANLGFLVLIVLTLVSIKPIHWNGNLHFGVPVVKDHWAVRVAPRVEGKVAIVEGGDILKMGLHYTQDDWRRAKPFPDVDDNIEIVRPGIYSNLSEAMQAFAAQGIAYVITDRNHIRRRPYLKEITQEKWEGVFQHIGRYEMGDRGAVLAGVNAYRIDYSKMP